MPEWLEKLATTASPALIFAVMWWLERMDRKEAQRDLKSLSERTIVEYSEIKGMFLGKRNGK